MMRSDGEFGLTGYEDWRMMEWRGLQRFSLDMKTGGEKGGRGSQQNTLK